MIVLIPFAIVTAGGNRAFFATKERYTTIKELTLLLLIL
jgi:hypothetical protein